MGCVEADLRPVPSWPPRTALCGSGWSFAGWWSATSATTVSFTGERGHARQRRQQATVAVCARCPVRTQCRTYALSVAEPYGVWGGLAETARDAILGRPAAGRAS